MTTEPSDLVAFYDRRWATADISAAKRQRGLAILSAIEAEGRQPLAVLELGCGTGWLSNELTRFGTCHGVDIAAAAIERARATYTAPTFDTVDLSHYRPTPSYDVVVSHEVIEHVTDQAYHLRIAHDALKPGGIVVLTTPNAYAGYGATAPVRQLYKPQPIENWLYRDEVRALIEAAGLRIETLTTIVPSREYRSRAIRALASTRLDAIAARVGKRDAWSATKGRLGLHANIFAIARRESRQLP